MMKSLLVLGFVTGLTGCAAGVDRAAQLDDIREATFRYLFVKNASGLQQHAQVYFLSVIDPATRKRRDSPVEFMARFATNTPRVADASAANSSVPTGVQDKQTGERGLIFHLGGIRWISDTEVEVDGGYFEASESAAGSTYFLTKKDGRWIVEREEMHWIK